MVVLQYFGKVMITLGLIVGLMDGVAWSEAEKPEQAKPAQENVLKNAFSDLVRKKTDAEVSKSGTDDEMKVKASEVKKEIRKPVKSTKVTKKTAPPVKSSAKSPAKPVAKVEKKEEGVLSKITESVIEVLTPGSKGTKKTEEKVVAKVDKEVKKKKVKSANSDNELLAKEGEKSSGEKKSNSLIDSFKRLAGGSEKSKKDKNPEKTSGK